MSFRAVLMLFGALAICCLVAHLLAGCAVDVFDGNTTDQEVKPIAQELSLCNAWTEFDRLRVANRQACEPRQQTDLGAYWQDCQDTRRPFAWFGYAIRQTVGKPLSQSFDVEQWRADLHGDDVYKGFGSCVCGRTPVCRTYGFAWQ